MDTDHRHDGNPHTRWSGLARSFRACDLLSTPEHLRGTELPTLPCNVGISGLIGKLAVVPAVTIQDERSRPLGVVTRSELNGRRLRKHFSMLLGAFEVNLSSIVCTLQGRGERRSRLAKPNSEGIPDAVSEEAEWLPDPVEWMTLDQLIQSCLRDPDFRREFSRREDGILDGWASVRAIQRVASGEAGPAVLGPRDVRQLKRDVENFHWFGVAVAKGTMYFASRNRRWESW